MSEYIVPIITVLFSTISSIVASYLIFKPQSMRVPSQNAQDDMTTAKIALEISETSIAKQQEMQKQIDSLTSILKSTHYKVTVVFSLGEKPSVVSAAIEAVKPPQSSHVM